MWHPTHSRTARMSGPPACKAQFERLVSAPITLNDESEPSYFFLPLSQILLSGPAYLSSLRNGLFSMLDFAAEPTVLMPFWRKLHMTRSLVTQLLSGFATAVAVAATAFYFTGTLNDELRRPVRFAELEAMREAVKDQEVALAAD